MLALLALTGPLLAGCARSGFGTRAPDASVDASHSIQLRIVTVEDGVRTPLEPMPLKVATRLALEAALYRGEDEFVGSAPAVWSLVGSDLPSADLDWARPASITATFTPSATAVAIIRAEHLDSELDGTSYTALAGPITVATAGEPAKLVIDDGDRQTGTVSSPLPQPLSARVLDAFDTPLAGVRVAFRVTLGGGAILGVSPAVSDAEGRASVEVQLGPTAGAGNHTFSASVVDQPEIALTFSASATAGPAAALVFDVQPGGRYAGAPLSTQPVVSLRDAQGNVVPAADNVTLSVLTGSGALTGSVVEPLASGVATFRDVGYDTIEAGVVLRASVDTWTVDAAPLDLGALPPGACQRNDEHFRTSAGGCEDLTSGLVWSSVAPATISWYAAVWDSERAGAPPTNGDLGRTNDYAPEPVPCHGNCDTDPTGYCHDLGEGDQQDWRLPTIEELVALSQNARQGSPPYLQGPADRNIWLWSSTTPPSPQSSVWIANLASGTSEKAGKLGPRSAICVRGQRSADLELVIEQAPRATGTGSAPIDPLEVRIRDALGNQVNAEGLTLSLQSATPLGGTLTAETDMSGLATFDSWHIDREGTAVIEIVAAGITKAEISVPVGPFPHTCLVEEAGAFATADGGCKDLGTQMVWSAPSSAMISWHDTIWDAENPLPSSGVQLPRRLPDADDRTRTNDYDNSPNARPDTSYGDFCHDLEQGGFSDWRVPSRNELNSVYDLGRKAAATFGFDVDRPLWSAYTSNTFAVAQNLDNGTQTNLSKTSLAWAICVRSAL